MADKISLITETKKWPSRQLLVWQTSLQLKKFFFFLLTTVTCMTDSIFPIQRNEYELVWQSQSLQFKQRQWTAICKTISSNKTKKLLTGTWTTDTISPTQRNE